MTVPAAAAGAYANVARLAEPAAGFGKAADGTAAGPSFGALLKDALSSVAETSPMSRRRR